MKERPIIFDAESVRAILDGRKTMTRRVIKSQPEKPPYPFQFPSGVWAWQSDTPHKWGNQTAHFCPLGSPRDFLWVREGLRWSREGSPARYAADDCPIMRDGESVGWIFNNPTVPAIFMPRWASRLLLEITAVRVERVQEISEEDAIAEGVRGDETCYDQASARMCFEARWDSLNARRGYGWAENPWVWVISFRRVKP